MTLKRKLLIMGLLPMVILAGLTILILALAVPKLNERNMKSQLKAVCLTMQEVFDQHEGGYRQTSEGVFKGDLNLTGAQEKFDEISANTGLQLTFFWNDVRTTTSLKDSKGKPMTGTKCDTAVAEAVLERGEQYFNKKLEIGGITYYVMYSPLYDDVTDKIIGMLFVGAPTHENNADMQSIISKILICMLVVFAGCFVLSTFNAKRITVAVVGGINIAEQLAAGYVNLEVDDRLAGRSDEIGTLARSEYDLSRKLHEIVGKVKGCSDDLNSSSEGLNKIVHDTDMNINAMTTAVNDIAEATSAQATDALRANESMDIIEKAINDTDADADRLDSKSRQMKTNSDEGLNILGQLKEVNSKAGTAIDAIYEQTNTTNRSAKDIQAAVTIIADIASETTLLSLNASIEAARAGEFGRGFGVVASEIQKLADQSNASAESIRQVVESLLADSDNAVKTMDEVKQIIEIQNDHVDKTASIFNEVGHDIDDAVDAAHNISQRVEQLREAKAKVQDVLSSLSAAAEENAAGAEETSASMETVTTAMQNVLDSGKALEELAAQLEELITFFKE